MDDSKILIAEIGAAHGIKGDVRMRLFLEDISLLNDLKPLTTKAGKVLEITSLRPQKDNFIAHISGIEDRNAAETLTKTKLFADKDKLPEPGEEEFYYSDLEGMDVLNLQNTPIGKVVKVVDYGAGDLLEIRFDGVAATHFVPFTEDRVPHIDAEHKLVTVDISGMGILAEAQEGEES